MERRKIKDLIAEKAILEVQDGNHGEKHPTAADYVEQGIPFLMARDFKNGQVDLSSACKIPKSLGDSLRIGFARPGDVLLTHKGSVGLVAIVPAVADYVMLTPQVTYYRANPEKLSNSYLKYAFQAPLFRDQLNSFSAQSTRPYIGITAQKELQLDVPPLPIQRRIAGILSAYDELIENSQRRIKILESMARALYREWFVHFRFPGHEHHPRVPSPLGEIPQGWEGSFGGLATIKRDSINPFEFPEEEFEHFSLPAFDNGRQPAIEQGVAILSGKYLIDDSTVLLSKLNPRIPRIWLPVPSGRRRAITSTEFIGLKPRSGVTREFIYAKCCSDEFSGQFGSLAIGTSTSHQRVKPENLLAMPSIVPDPSTIARFTKLVSSMLTVSQQLRSQIQNLRRTRDLLLPRLLSGQINVEAMPA